MKLLQRSTWLAGTAAALMAGVAATPAHAERLHWTLQVALPVPVVTVPLPRIERVPVVVAPGWGGRDCDDRRDDRRHAPRPGWRVDRDRDGVPDWRDPYDNRREGHRDARPGWRERW